MQLIRRLAFFRMLKRHNNGVMRLRILRDSSFVVNNPYGDI